MNPIIQHIITELSHLPPPIPLERIKALFDNNPAFNHLDDPACLDSFCVELNVIRQLAEEGVQLTTKLKDLRLYDEEFNQYKHSENQLQEQLHELNRTLHGIQRDIECTRKKLTSLFTQLINHALTDEDMRKDLFNEMALINTPDTLSQWQTTTVLQLRTVIENELILLSVPTAKKQLLELKASQNHLLGEIQHLCLSYNIDTPGDLSPTPEIYLRLIPTLERYLDNIIELKPQLEQLQEDFSTCISSEDINKQKQELNTQQEQIQKELGAINQRLQESTLSPDKKKELKEAYASRGQKLLMDYKNSLPDVLSLLNPGLWFNLLHESQAKEQDEFHCSFQFLTELNLQKEKQDALETIQNQLQLLPSLPFPTAENKKDTKQEYKEKTRILINKLPPALANIPDFFDPNDEGTAYYLLLIHHIVYLSQKKNDYESLLPHLHDLMHCMTELTELRQKYHLLESQDHLLPSIDELNRVVPEAQLLAAKEAQLKQCDAFLNEIGVLITYLKQKREEESKIKNDTVHNLFDRQVLAIELEKKRHIEYKEPIPEQISHVNQQLLVLQNDLTNKLQHIQDRLSLPATPALETAEYHAEMDSTSLPDRTDSSMVLAEENQPALPMPPQAITPDTPLLLLQTTFFPIDDYYRPDESPIRTPLNTIIETDSPELAPAPATAVEEAPPVSPQPVDVLEQWHQHILAALQDQPESYTQWYLALYQQALSATNPLTRNKYTHLLRDLFFELHIKKEWDVFLTYQRLSPNPVTHCTALLRLKPHYPIEDHASPSAAMLHTLPASLRAFYKHSLTLKVKYPVEAELALQAFSSLVSTYQASNNQEASLYKAPLITQDPRYTPLKRHRGILQLWEQIEDFFRLLIGMAAGQNAYQYQKKPCFFNTTTNKLFEEAQACVEEKSCS
ncbi:MAG: hypothetical protein CK426_07680 [Legionella sp.]|nr:MAG: hypothetical protein CK423_05530 [Legionella sp.]PJD97757.1 MAG: hypothetical protein CK426_07680 [Legionella sp.]